MTFFNFKVIYIQEKGGRNIFKILIIIIFISIAYEDIKKHEISNLKLIVLMFVFMLKSLKFDALNYISSSMHIFPFFILMVLEEILGKDVIGFADIKLMAILNFFIVRISIKEVYIDFSTIYLISSLYSIIKIAYCKYLRKISIKESLNSYIPFTPFILLYYVMYI